MTEEARKRLEILLLRKWQLRAKSPSTYERHVISAMRELKKLEERGIPRKCVEKALEIYRKALDNGLAWNRPTENVVIAALYAACRMLNVPQTLDELAAYAEIPQARIIRYYELLSRELGIKAPAADPIAYVHKFAEQLKLPNDVVETAVDVLKKAKEVGMTTGKDPVGLAAAAIYVAATLHNYNITKGHIASVARVTNVTIRNRSKELIKIYESNRQSISEKV